MALAGLLGALLGTALFGLIAAALGHRLLRLCHLALDSSAEHLLCSAALGVITVEVGLFLAQLATALRMGIGAVLVLCLAVGSPDIPAVLHDVRDIFSRLRKSSRGEKALAWLFAVIVAFEGISAMAPVTGSDALQYHFAWPLMVLREGFHPDFFLLWSFFCGQSHLLILAGLAAGSDKLAMGFIFLGGLLAAAATFCLARMWMSRSWSWLVVISFLVTPVVFWQASSAAAPDIWMCFFATMGAILLIRMEGHPSLGYAALLGVLAGGVAGTKYIACCVALGLAISFLWEDRSWRGTGAFLAGALAAGIWPYARNWVWTGDPMFPFLLRWLAPASVNAYTLATDLAAARGRDTPTLFNLFRFSLFAEVDRTSAQLYQFLGPLPLAFAAFLPLAVRNTRAWRVSLTVWLTSALTIGATSSTQRYLLPVFPILLAAVFAGIAHLDTLEWLIARRITLTIAILFIASAAGGLLLYDSAAFRAAIGTTDRQDYLLRRAPNYEQTEFVNRILGGVPKGQINNKVMIFWNHVYYLDVPYVMGIPEVNWAIDPVRFQTAEEWRALFRKEHIGWVVRAPGYPDNIARPLQALETQGVLIPLAHADVSDFTGMRFTDRRVSSNIVILQVLE